MQIDVGSYYLISTSYGDRVIKAQELDSQGIPYGTFSISEFVVPKDGQGTQILTAIRLATPTEAQDWDTWYNS
jgi:hypothetical protein